MIPAQSQVEKRLRRCDSGSTAPKAVSTSRVQPTPGRAQTLARVALRCCRAHHGGMAPAARSSLRQGNALSPNTPFPALQPGVLVSFLKGFAMLLPVRPGIPANVSDPASRLSSPAGRRTADINFPDSMLQFAASPNRRSHGEPGQSGMRLLGGRRIPSSRSVLVACASMNPFPIWQDDRPIRTMRTQDQTWDQEHHRQSSGSATPGTSADQAISCYRVPTRRSYVGPRPEKREGRVSEPRRPLRRAQDGRDQVVAKFQPVLPAPGVDVGSLEDRFVLPNLGTQARRSVAQVRENCRLMSQIASSPAAEWSGRTTGSWRFSRKSSSNALHAREGASPISPRLAVDRSCGGPMRGGGSHTHRSPPFSPLSKRQRAMPQLAADAWRCETNWPSRLTRRQPRESAVQRWENPRQAGRPAARGPFEP